MGVGSAAPQGGGNPEGVMMNVWVREAPKMVQPDNIE